jgi:hypothetical protein
MLHTSVIVWVLRLLGGVPLEEINPSSSFFWFYSIYSFDPFFFCRPASDAGRSPSPDSDGGNISDERSNNTKGKGKSKGKKASKQ